jgi:hypothetical protein
MVPEYLAHAKANPGKIAVVSSDRRPCLAWQATQDLGKELTSFSYPSAAGTPSLTDVLGWLVQVYFGARYPSLEARAPGNIVDALDGANSGGLANDTLAARIAELGAIVLPGLSGRFRQSHRC